MQIFHHSVHIKLKPDVPKEESDRLFDWGKSLGEATGGKAAGILLWKFEVNLDTRKGVTWVEVALFTTKEKFQEFLAQQTHKDFGEALSKIADWTVGDAIIDMPINL